MPPWATSRCAGTLFLCHAPCPTYLSRPPELSCKLSMPYTGCGSTMHDCTVCQRRFPPCGNPGLSACQHHIIYLLLDAERWRVPLP